MYYGKLLRQIVEASKNLAERLLGISEKIDKNAESISAANEREQQQQKIRQKWADEILAEYKKSEGNRTANDDRQYRVQNSLRWATWLAFGAAAVYAGIAACQLSKMDATYREMQNQTYAACLNTQATQKAFLQAKQAAIDAHEGSVAAYAQALAAIENQKSFVDVQFVATKDRPYNEPLTLKLTISNTGKAAARNVLVAGRAFAAQPNSHPKVGEPAFTISKGILNVGEVFLPEHYPGFTEPTRSIHVDVADENGKTIINTPEIDREIFAQRKKYIFVYYTLTYEDFSSKYLQKVCVAIMSWQNGEAKPTNGSDIDKQCNDSTKYNMAIDTPKIEMPPPSAPISIPAPDPVVCAVPKKGWL